MTGKHGFERSELLIVKVGKDYARFVEGGFECRAMNKASVFPLADLELVREKCAACFAGDTDYILRKLVITEEPFEGE